MSGSFSSRCCSSFLSHLSTSDVLGDRSDVSVTELVVVASNVGSSVSNVLGLSDVVVVVGVVVVVVVKVVVVASVVVVVVGWTVVISSLTAGLSVVVVVFKKASIGLGVVDGVNATVGALVVSDSS